MISTLLASALLLASPSRMDEVLQLYRDFEYEEALERITESDSDDDFALMEGILCAELNKKQRALRAFRRALAKNPSAELPFEVAPKVSDLFKQAQAEQRDSVVMKEPPPLDHVPREYRIKAAAWALADAAGPSLGVGINAGAEWHQWEADLRLSFGKSLLGVGLSAGYLFDLGRFRPKAGLRGWLFTGPVLAGGGGPMVGAELRVYEGLYLIADVAAELYAVSATSTAVASKSVCEGDNAPASCFKTVGVVFTLGTGYAF